MPASHPRLSEHVFIVFADDWGRHPSSCQHLFRRIIPHAQVIWVNTIGLRTPRINLHDFRRTMQVIRAWVRPDAQAGTRARAGGSGAVLPPAHCALPNGAACPHILSPVMWPSFRSRGSVAFNHHLLSRAVHKALRHIAPGKHPILVSTSPTVPGLFRDHAFRRKVYYCVDDFTHWRGIDGRAVHRLEQETLDACDLMIAASASILETRSSCASVSTLLTHGVDLTHFSCATRDPSSPLAALPRPLVGMFGIFDRRVDGKALKAAALLSPQATFVILGPVVDRDPGEFRDLPNVRFMGSVPYADLPGHVCHFDLCMLPYVVDESTHHINPLKLKEYLATGKPVIASPIPEAIGLADHLVLADAQAFPGAVASALSVIAPASAAKPIRLRPRLEDFLRSESWEAKAACFLSKVMEGL